MSPLQLLTNQLQVPDMTMAFFDWMRNSPALTALLILMAADILTGIAASVILKTLSSSASWRGMSKKVMMLILVSVGAVIEPFAGGIPIAKLVASFYIVTESLSIIENAARCGVPLPRVLLETLARLRETDNASPVVNLQIKATHAKNVVDNPIATDSVSKPSGDSSHE